MARDVGYGIDGQGVRREAMTQASIEAYEGDSTRMASLIRAGLRDLDHEYARDLASAVVGDEAQLTLAVPGNTYEGTVIGSTECFIVQEQRDHAGAVVLHSRRALINAQIAIPGQAVEIRYPHGGAGLVEKSIEGPKHESLLQRENNRELDR